MGQCFRLARLVPQFTCGQCIPENCIHCGIHVHYRRRQYAFRTSCCPTRCVNDFQPLICDDPTTGVGDGLGLDHMSGSNSVVPFPTSVKSPGVHLRVDSGSLLGVGAELVQDDAVSVSSSSDFSANYQINKLRHHKVK